MMVKKKIGVITFHNYDNYGAILQSYALQYWLKKLGTDPQIIDYKCDYISNPFRLSRISAKGIFNYIYGIIGYFCYLPRRVKCNKFRKLLSYSKHVDKKTIADMDGKYDVFISGSDQVWDWSLTGFDKAYFLDFVTNGKKCSYAASIGEHLPIEEYREEYTRLLGRFDHILMRESYGADVVEKLTGSRPDCACDPTLLLTGEEWESLMSKPSKKKPYILVYQLGVNPDFVNFVKKVKKKLNLPVIYIPFPLVGFLKHSPQITAGPMEWLRLFRDAQYVITDSFHGAVFSLLFHKPFFVQVDGHHVNKRVKELLENLDLTDRIISNDITEERLTSNIDYEKVDEKLHAMRENSIENLKKIIM